MGNVAFNHFIMYKKILYLSFIVLLFACNSNTNKLNKIDRAKCVKTDTLEWDKYDDIVYPHHSEIDIAIVELSKFYYGINEVLIPSGEYWVATIYKNTESYYTDITNNVPLFNSFEKMSDIETYNGNGYSSILSNGIGLIDSLICDSIMPQFAYFNELYSENHYEYRAIKQNDVYYVGFDFYADSFVIRNVVNEKLIRPIQIKDRDYRYNDWVIMLISAKRKKNAITFKTKLKEYLYKKMEVK